MESVGRERKFLSRKNPQKLRKQSTHLKVSQIGFPFANPIRGNPILKTNSRGFLVDKV